MSVRMINMTAISDEALLKMLEMAKTLADARGAIVSIITRGKRGGGQAHHANKAYVSRKRMGLREFKGDEYKAIPTHGGYIEVNPSLYYEDPLICATRMMRTSIHEYVHVRDFQTHKVFKGYNKNWKNRIHEKRAERKTDEAIEANKSNPAYQDAVLGLAIAIDDHRKKKLAEEQIRIAKWKAKREIMKQTLMAASPN